MSEEPHTNSTHTHTHTPCALSLSHTHTHTYIQFYDFLADFTEEVSTGEEPQEEPALAAKK